MNESEGVVLKRSVLEQLLFVFTLPPLIQQRVHMSHASHLQSLCNPSHHHQRLVPQPHYDLQLLKVAFVSTSPPSIAVSAILLRLEPKSTDPLRMHRPERCIPKLFVKERGVDAAST